MSISDEWSNDATSWVSEFDDSGYDFFEDDDDLSPNANALTSANLAVVDGPNELSGQLQTSSRTKLSYTNQGAIRNRKCTKNIEEIVPKSRAILKISFNFFFCFIE